MTADLRAGEPVASTLTSNGTKANSDDGGATRSQSKKRRIPGACDICKRKKIRCDSGELPGNICSNCIQLGLECTHKEVTKTLGSAKGYVESLEARLEKMDKLLKRLLPGVNLNEELNKTDDKPLSPKPLPRNEDQTEIVGKLSKLTIDPRRHRFFGKSSQYELLQTALDLREEFTGEGVAYVQSALPMKRPEFWDVPEWMSYNPELDEEKREYAFPDDDLYPSLVDAYFTQINPWLPLLHRPTFEGQVKEGLHHVDSMFARVFLLVCAHGARYSDDPRVFPDGTTSTRSGGWKWFEQVNVLRKNLFNRTVLHELQMHALYVLFASSSETPQGVWAQIGMALRLSQEVGGHRQRMCREGSIPSIENELWKRAFWVILSLDRLISSASGRPCGLQDEDFDLDRPVEVDDEYWEQGFVQPEGQPSSIAYFNCYLGLMDIKAYAMRLIYSIKNSKYAGKAGQRSEQQIIAELDAAMNNWMDSLPEHLRWNPSCKNELFLKQSSALHATYYHIQILIHRPFIPSPRNPTPGAFPSLAICTNAARSCCHVLEVFSKLSPLPNQPFQLLAFTAALILLLNIWSGKRSGSAPNPKREMEDVRRCMDMLKTAEKRWASAGRFVDLLTELASAGDLTAAIYQNTKKKTTKKRSRSDSEVDEDASSSSPSSDTAHSPPLSPIEPRSIAGTRRVSQSQQTSPTSHAEPSMNSPTESPINFSLPMYSNDLGRLPVYGQFNFVDPSNVNAFLGEQFGQIHTSVPILASLGYHFDQPHTQLQVPAQSQPQPQLQSNITTTTNPNPMSLASLGLMSLTSDPAADLFTSSTDSFAYDSMLKDAIFSGDVSSGHLSNASISNMTQASSSNTGGGSINTVAGSSSNSGTAGGRNNGEAGVALQPPPLPNLTMSTADIASLIAQCSGVDYTALLQQLVALSQLQAQQQHQQQPMLDFEMMRMWNTAPASLELDEWGSFISSVEQLTQSQSARPSGS